MHKAIIVDIDGTLALRNPDGQTVDVKGEGKYRGIHDYHRVIEDLLHEPIHTIVKAIALGPDDISIIITTGRPDSCRDQTISWFDKHDIPFDFLLMRKTGDYRKDSIVKKEIYDTCIKPVCDVIFVLDDRQQVVDMWREQGLTCLQVAPGNF